MEILTQVWTWIISILSGVTVAGIVSAIVYGCIRGSFKRTIAKINIKDVCKETIKETLKDMKTITYTQNIQPLVESGLEKVNEKSAQFINEKNKQLEARYDKLIKIMEKLSAYFDNSIGVSEQAKAELKEAIKEAKQDTQPELIVEDEVVFEVEKVIPTENKEQEVVEEKAKIER